MSNNNNTVTVTSLLKEEGFGPRLTFSGFSAAVWLAEAVSQTISAPIRRAQFVADSAADLAQLDYQPFKGLEDLAQSLAENAEAQIPTPCGNIELWGAFMQWVESA